MGCLVQACSISSKTKQSQAPCEKINVREQVINGEKKLNSVNRLFGEVIQARTLLSHSLSLSYSSVVADSKNVFTDRLSSKPFLIWLLTAPPHLKYVATLPCNLSLIT